MHIKEKKENTTGILTLSGALLCEPDAMKMLDRVHQLIGEGIQRFVVDFKAVTYMNSCGLGLLLSCFTSIKKAGGDLRLVGVGNNIHNLFVITQLTQVFKVSHTVEEALSDFQSAPIGRK